MDRNAHDPEEPPPADRSAPPPVKPPPVPPPVPPVVLPVVLKPAEEPEKILWARPVVRLRFAEDEEPILWARPVGPPVAAPVRLQRPYPKPPHPGFWWAALWCVVYVHVTQIPAAVAGVVILLVLVIRDPGGMERLLRDPDALMRSPQFADAMLPAIFLSQVLGVLGGWLAVRLVVGRDWPRALALRRPNLSHVCLVLLGVPGMYVLAAGIDALAKRLLPSFMDLDAAESMFGRWPWPLAVLIIGVGPGLAEELFCRGFLGRGLVGRFGVVGGVLLTSMLFALIHMEPRQVAYTFPMGMLLHLAYLATRSLWIPVLAHTASNSLAVLMLHLPELNRSLDPIPWYLFPAAALLLATLGWALYQSRPRLVARQPDKRPWLPDFPGVAFPPTDTGTDVVRPRPSAAAWLIAAGGMLLFAGSFYLAIVKPAG